MSDVIVSREGAALIITINRPDARNAVNNAVASGIAAAIQQLNEDPSLSVGIVTGAGGNFCAGMDLKAFLRGEPVKVPGYGFAGITEATIAKPIIAAVEGYCLAGGFELALSCDLIVASAEARFGLPEVRRGLVAAAGGLMRLPRQMPYRLALELALRGNMTSAEHLHRHGLVNHVTEAGGSLGYALEIARELCENGPLALAATKQIMQSSQDWPANEMFDRQKELADPVFQSADAREAAQAFAEKRTPQWSGR